MLNVSMFTEAEQAPITANKRWKVDSQLGFILGKKKTEAIINNNEIHLQQTVAGNKCL